MLTLRTGLPFQESNMLTPRLWLAPVTRTWIAAIVLGAAGACSTPTPSARPHVDHVTLPAHKTWAVVSVQPYEGLEDVELVKVNWPTADAPTTAFALTREGLDVGDAICLDHVQEIDTLWAHPVPAGGCAALGQRAAP
jgi:hypothetical protein